MSQERTLTINTQSNTKPVCYDHSLGSRYCDQLVQSFRVTCLFTSQYNTKGYGTITDVGSRSCWLDPGKSPPTIFRLASWFWNQP